MRAPEPSGGSRFGGVETILRAAVRDRVCPAAAIEVGRRQGPVWVETCGRLTYEESAAPCTPATIFDLASLTKVIATTTLAMQAVAHRRLDLTIRVREVCRAWRGSDRQAVTLRHLLEHASGLPAHRPLWKTHRSAADVEHAIARLPLEHAPGTAAVYSDAGFILLGMLLERVLGGTLDELFADVGPALGPTLRFTPPASLRGQIAPTEFDPWRQRLLQGEVHDENAALLGGVAGHAGLFGTVREVGAFARLVLSTFQQATLIGDPDTMLTFATKSALPGSSRALGWDTMLPTSSCGTKFSARAIGHTGFTGTSLWVDPALDVYVVLLTNRVHPSRTNNRLQALRPLIHDVVLEELA